MTQEIVDLLDTYHYRALQRMAEVVGIDRDLGKDDLVAEMAANYFTERRIRASLMLLDEAARAVFDRLRRLGGDMTTQRLRDRVVDDGLVEAPPKEGGHLRGRTYGFGAPYADGNYVGKVSRCDSRVFEDVMARLALHGLVFSRDAGATYSGVPYKVRLHPGTTVFIPDAVARHLPDPNEPPPSKDEWEPDRVTSGAPDLLMRDLYLTWDVVRRGVVRLNKSGFISKRSLRAIDNTLLVSDPGLENAKREDETTRLHLLCQLLERLGLVRRAGDHLRAAGPEGRLVPTFWARSLGEQVVCCLDAWQSTAGPVGLRAEIEDWLPRYAQARAILRTTLARFGPEIWLEAEDVLTVVHDEHEAFLFSERMANHPSHWAYVHSAGPGVQFIQRCALRFIASCVRGFLHDVGVVALGYDGNQVGGFRVTKAGQAMLRGESPSVLPGQPEGAGRLVVQPTFDVMAMGPVELDTLARLDLCAERKRVDRAVFEYRLSRTSLDEARRWGVTPAQVIEFLETRSGTGLPQNVRRSMDGWARSQERIVFRSGVHLLETAADQELTELMDDAEIRRYLARAVAPTVALVDDDQRDALMAALVARGCLPHSSDAGPGAADESVIVHQDGLIEPVHAVPGFHVRSRLKKLAEPAGDGTWRMTAASIRRAGGNRERVLDLLSDLRRLSRDQLSNALKQRIKAEGGYYGSANTETLTLVAFRDRQTLDELREEDPGLGALLRPFEAGDRALAVVARERLSEVRERLAAFGVEVREEAISSS